MTVASELVKINYSVRNNGGMILLPEVCLDGLANLHVPSEADTYAESATQQYPLGTQLRLNGNIYRYCKAGAAMTQAGFLKGNYIQCPGKAGNSVGAGFEGALYAAVEAGDTIFKLADTAATKNLYEDAILVVYDDTNVAYQTYRVLGNDASNGTYTVCYIAPPGFKYDTSTSIGVTVYLSPWIGIRTVTGGYMSALGWAKFSITSAYYFWLQTAGIISGVTGASTWPGQTQYQRDVFCNTDGSLITGNSGTTELYQRVGYLLARTASDYGDNLVMLQLDQ